MSYLGGFLALSLLGVIGEPSSAILPNNPFYSLKLYFEDLQIRFLSKEEYLDYYLFQLDERLKEIYFLGVNQADFNPERPLKHYLKTFGKLKSLLKKNPSSENYLSAYLVLLKELGWLEEISLLLPSQELLSVKFKILDFLKQEVEMIDFEILEEKLEENSQLWQGGLIFFDELLKENEDPNFRFKIEFLKGKIENLISQQSKENQPKENPDLLEIKN